MFSSIDPEALRQQYANDQFLRTRQTMHQEYSVPKVHFPDWVLDRIEWRGDEVVLDVGAGTGTYYDSLRTRWPDVKYYGFDKSAGILKTHRAPATLAVADAEHLPFPDETFDVVMANHVLYHVPNIEQAISECRRVLKPDGLLVTATNSQHTMPEFQALFRRALILLSAPGHVYNQVPNNPFSLESGVPLLARQFYAVVRHDLPSAFVFPSIEPVMDYLQSWRSMREPELPGDIKWDELMVVVQDQIDRVMNHFGELIVNKISGVLIATNSGGFIQEYVRRLQTHTTPSPDELPNPDDGAGQPTSAP
ncbi:MAG: methyltransferase domain-containing protein [Chloroflexi bacterium]|nr:methyltransferase domain-containing protein [Chloroflexota bacterium]